MASMPIPKIIHSIWTGDRAPTGLHGACRQSVRRTHDRWAFREWHDDNLLWLLAHPSLCGRAIAKANLPADPRMKSDVLRLAALYVYGGVYLDHDIWCVKALDELCTLDLVFGEHARSKHDPARGMGRWATGVIGAPPRHPVIGQALKRTLDEGGGMGGFQRTARECGARPLPFEWLYPHYHRQPSMRYRIFPVTRTVHCWRKLDYDVERLKEMSGVNGCKRQGGRGSEGVVV